jgi:hypothetical protein
MNDISTYQDAYSGISKKKIGIYEYMNIQSNKWIIRWDEYMYIKSNQIKSNQIKSDQYENYNNDDNDNSRSENKIKRQGKKKIANVLDISEIHPIDSCIHRLSQIK